MVNDWVLQLETMRKHKYCHIVVGNFLLYVTPRGFCAYVKESTDQWWSGDCTYFKLGV
jgi:hypothetical protein